jgi:hypothetical protein
MEMDEKPPGGLTPEEVFEAQVGVVLSEANIHFRSKDWAKLATSSAKLWALFLVRIKAEMLLLQLKNRNVPENERN